MALLIDGRGSNMADAPELEADDEVESAADGGDGLLESCWLLLVVMLTFMFMVMCDE